MDLFKIEKKVAKKWTAHGLDCVVTFHGQHNGYARVSKGHPLFGVGYNEKIDIKPNWNRSMEDGAFGGMLALLSGHDAAEEWLRTPEGLIEVHGGVTYAGEYCPLIPETDPWWFGFDTNHCDDYSVAHQDLQIMKIHARYSQNPRAWFEYIARLSCGEIERDYQKEASFDGRHFWTLEETVAETEKMAKQLAALKEER